MKRCLNFVIFTAATLCIVRSAMAQTQGIGLHFGAYDFYGPQTGNYFFVNQNVTTYKVDTSGIGIPPGYKNEKATHHVLAWQPLIRVTYWWKLNRWFDLNAGLSLANAQYPVSNPDSQYINRIQSDSGIRAERFLGELDARVNFNILEKEKHLFSPYLFAGITASCHNGYFGADFPAGAGLNVKVDKGLYLNLEAGYKVALTSNDFNHLQYTAGFVYWFKPGYKSPNTPDTTAPQIPVAAVNYDMDNDGVPDSVDKCPTIPGPAEYDGCPDTDNDSIPDNIDQCPLVPGLARFNGCPDSDGDGIPDNKDKCPYVAGLPQYDGCPAPDSDHDGVPDDSDRCPNIPGPAWNYGCPEIKKEVIEKVQKAAHAVFFETGKAAIKKVSYRSLNRIVEVMKNDPSLYVDISGYTDNVGKPELNEKLSDARANACRNYLISQGISRDRITAKGYGEANPIANNKTALGRAQNRRTEFKLRNYKQ